MRTVPPAVSRILLGIALVLLLVLAWTGVRGGLEQFPGHTTGQRAQTIAQLAFGVFSLLSIVVLSSAPQWHGVAFGGFVLSLAMAGGLAPVVWAHESVGTGLVSGAASLLVGWGIIWLLRTGARHASTTEPG